MRRQPTGANVVAGSPASRGIPAVMPTVVVAATSRGACGGCKAPVGTDQPRMRVAGVYYHASCFRDQCQLCSQTVALQHNRLRVQSGGYVHTACFQKLTGSTAGHTPADQRPPAAPGSQSQAAAPEPAQGPETSARLAAAPELTSGDVSTVAPDQPEPILRQHALLAWPPDRVARGTIRRAADKVAAFSYSALATATSGFGPPSLIGTGTFGEVFRGRMPQVGLDVACKVFKDAFDDVARAAFAAEVEQLSKTPHPHFLQLLGVCADGPQGQFIIVTTFMAGGSLRDRLWHFSSAPSGAVSPRNALSWRQRLTALVGATKGLSFLYNYLRRSHGRIQPGGILLADLGVSKAVLGDVGWGQALGSAPQAKNTIADASDRSVYGSPELARSDVPANPSSVVARIAADVYALGVVAVEVLSSISLDAESPAERARVLAEIRQGNIAVITKQSPQFDVAAVTDCAAVAIDCISLEAANRPPVDVVLSRLEVMCAGAGQAEIAEIARQQALIAQRMHLAEADDTFVEMCAHLGIASTRDWASTDQKGEDSRKTFPLDERSMEFRRIETRFSGTLPHCTIRLIERIENGFQLRKFSAHAAGIEKKLGAAVDRRTSLRLLFHGTPHVDSIANDPVSGFKPLLAGAHSGTTYGLGTLRVWHVSFALCHHV